MRRVRHLRAFFCVTLSSRRETSSRKAGMKLCLSAKIISILCIKAYWPGFPGRMPPFNSMRSRFPLPPSRTSPQSQDHSYTKEGQATCAAQQKVITSYARHSYLPSLSQSPPLVTPWKKLWKTLHFLIGLTTLIWHRHFHSTTSGHC